MRVGDSFYLCVGKIGKNCKRGAQHKGTGDLKCMPITMKQIADLANVSAATVSKIINGRDEHISDRTRNRVLELIKEYNYLPNTVAKGLKERQTKTIGFILPDITNPFFPEIAQGIEHTSNEMGFAVVFCDTDNDAEREQESVAFLRSKMVDGLIFIRSLRNSFFESYLMNSIPTVIVDRKINAKDAGIGEISIDTNAAIYDITSLLIQRGCRNIAFISGGSESSSRFCGYKRALEEHDLPFSRDNVFWGDFDIDTGHEGASTIISRNIVDAIVCGNDLIATGAIKEIMTMGYNVPKDIKVTGMDDIYLSRFLYPSLTTVAQPAYQMGCEAAKMLISHILYHTEMTAKQLDYEIVIRDSI